MSGVHPSPRSFLPFLLSSLAAVPFRKGTRCRLRRLKFSRHPLCVPLYVLCLSVILLCAALPLCALRAIMYDAGSSLLENEHLCPVGFRWLSLLDDE